MKGKIILNLAISLDGYIASEDGSYEWIVGDGDSTLDTDKYDFDQFLKDIDVVVMGKKCYDQNMHQDFKSKKVYVATSQEMKGQDSQDNLHFVSGDICKVIMEEKESKNIFLFGGGGLVDNFLKADIIDEYIIGIIPIILGKGRPLFLENNPMIKLHLYEYIIENGITILKYSRRSNEA